ncbi:MAG: response regulator transcription factor [Chitinophagaceae bacterium]|nr:response regulator transcription factor [Chitinophagaceae bacterium]
MDKTNWKDEAKQKKVIKIAIVDDHQIVIDGLVSLLSNYAQFSIVLVAVSPIEILEQLENIQVDVLMTDVTMPQMSGLDLAIAVKNKFPQTRILALSMNDQGEVINEMINKAGISGYLIKNVDKTELVSAIETIAAGGYYFNEEVLDELDSHCLKQSRNKGEVLTNREKEIINLIEKENSNKQIADQLFISERTVETHRKNIFRKTGTNSVLGLIKYAYQNKIILDKKY